MCVCAREYLRIKLLQLCPPVHALLFSDSHTHTHAHIGTHTRIRDTQKPFCTLPEDNSCAVRWYCKRKSIYPRGVVLMTFPAGSLSLSFSLGAKTGSFCVAWGESWRGGGVGRSSALAAGGLLSHRTQLFQDTGCTFDMCLLTLPMMPPLLPLSPGLGCLLASEG